MSLHFTVKEFILNGNSGIQPLEFYRRGFNINGEGGTEPSYIDIIISGTTSVTLTNAIGLNYVKLFGGTEQLPKNYIDSVTLDGKCVQSGTPTPTVPVDIVCNNGTIKFSANMANVNAQTALVGYYISAQGVVTADTSNWIYQDFIPVKPNTTYTLSMSSSVHYVTISEYSTADDSGFVIRKVGSTGSNTTLTITTGATTNYIRFGTNINRSVVTTDIVLAINWMLNQGNSMAYQPYVEGGIYIDGTVEVVTDSLGNTATAQNLLSINTYKDTQEILSGLVTRNVAIKVFDGSEVWIKISNQNAYYVMITDMLYCNPTQAGLSNQFVGSSLATADMPDNSIKLTYTTSPNRGAILFKHNDITTLEDWVQFVTDQYNAGTPVIVVYPLATATTETVNGQFLLKEPVTVTGSLTGLVANVVSSSHTTPTPTQPLPINCNNGVLKVSPNLFNKNSYTEINAYVNSNTGVLTQGSPGENTQYCAVIPCLPNTTYTISGRANSAWGAFTSSAINTTATSFNKTENGSITTGANDKYLIGLVRANQNVIDYRNALQVELGSTATPYMPYGQIYTDGTVETVEITGKNLFNISTNPIEQGNIASATGQNANSNYRCRTIDYIPVEPSTTYTLSASIDGYSGGVSSGLFVYQYNSDASSWRTSGWRDPAGYTFTTDVLTTKIRVVFSIALNINIVPSDISNVQLELGTTATAYEPYYNGGTATAEMLLKVGTYQDVQSVLDGHVTRNVGIKVLDGTEDWTKGSTVTRNTYFTPLSTFPDIDTINPLSSSHFIGTTQYSDLDYSGYTYVGSYVNFSMPTTIADSNASFKQWLTDQYNSGNPVIVIYPLATPTTETVTGQPLTVQNGTNIVEITQASIDGLPLEVSYKQQQ